MLLCRSFRPQRKVSHCSSCVATSDRSPKVSLHFETMHSVCTLSISLHFGNKKNPYRTIADKDNNEKGRSVIDNRLGIHAPCDSHNTRLMLPVIGNYLLDLLMRLLNTNFVITDHLPRYSEIGCQVQPRKKGTDRCQTWNGYV